MTSPLPLCIGTSGSPRFPVPWAKPCCGLQRRPSAGTLCRNEQRAGWDGRVPWTQFCSSMELGRSWGTAWLLHPLPRDFFGMADRTEGQCTELNPCFCKIHILQSPVQSNVLNRVKKENPRNSSQQLHSCGVGTPHAYNRWVPGMANLSQGLGAAG